MIAFSDITLDYLSDTVKTTPLNGLNLTISDGDFIAITGPSGSGKSSFVNVAAGLLKPTSGSVTYNGTDLYGLSRKSLALTRLSNVGIVFQDFRLIDHLTVMDNIVLPAKLLDGKVSDEKVERAKTLTEQLGINHRLHHFPSQLSGGQQQRVSIARALINNPTLVIADEPTGNLDHKNTLAIGEILQTLNTQGTTILLVTHDAEIVSLATNKFTIFDGKLERR
ncbi:ABC transporter ATP-binding protein [Alteromonas sp. McT4-15]|uniref:ABC transporter ATP-binding protein n=1 Tax=Alteromonas sp. McT4-15 TaxID=2881256 RepID=UPI001CF906E6|nr:ABC transporter ATP-binding protein [Alteromonas sp. McT4-15]MCB4438498.1 ABC transporter ATP-binding protein [Alteromonas sp. McT4-15]